MRQEVTRAHKGWALDMVALHNDVTKFVLEDIKTPPIVRLYIHYIKNPKFVYLRVMFLNIESADVEKCINKLIYH